MIRRAASAMTNAHAHDVMKMICGLKMCDERTGVVFWKTVNANEKSFGNVEMNE